MTPLDRLNRLAHVASKRTDVIIVAFMIMAVVMMIIPLPTYLVDTLIACNIALSLLVLIVAFYISHSVEFSALPPLILLSTLFRLALSITTTRLILLHADAGHIVQAFGDFVIAGQVVVGLVVFLIITVAQFVVITKGAERVAEVAARFTLDAMPGKQMSIDGDLRNGDIDQAEARRRRTRLERESQMFGAMDGSMKFVKGDAIAGLVILAVNLLGGMMIGMVQRDMAFGDAVHTYSLLTVGDGLIAQIPALLISVAAGTVVTRVNTDGVQEDLGAQIVKQLGASHRALALTAVILLGVSLLPGFPAVVFIGLAAALGAAAWFLYRRETAAAAAPEPEFEAVDEPVEEEATAPVVRPKPLHHRVLLVIGRGLANEAPEQPLGLRLEALSHALRAELGIDVPPVAVYVDGELPAQRFVVELEGVPVHEGELPADSLLLRDDVVNAELLDLEPLETEPHLGLRRVHWLPRDQQARLDQAGVGYQLVDEVLRDIVERTLRRYAADFLGIQETRSLLERSEAQYGELVKEALRSLPLQRMAEGLRYLLSEGVSIRNQRALLEAMVDWNDRDADALLLAEHLRAALARQICHQHADRNRVISALVLSPSAEQQLRASLRRREGTREVFPEGMARAALQQLRLASERLPEERQSVLLVHPELRRQLRRLAVRGDVDLAVLSFRELADEYHLQAVGTLDFDEAVPRRATTTPSTSTVATAQ